ncbi:hypothetical protein BSF41_28850 [Flavobacterium sp. ACN2]|jgi:hypothetical protein|uniref:DUF2185 domain-containing protein n=1 Tax=Flavobacterium sp. ACN2 TaxID=1975676 RepID=UPI000BB33903|nr:DUF2185 domain-containing protein [Flavobacterium sp. ACN2]PBI87448.1 hypothetical protein BSF41_28850 [Flavobacterium sp. ACN2]
MKFFKTNNKSNENNFENFPAIGGLMVSKMIVDQNIKPRFLYREKRARSEDSGWRIFTGFESEEYTDDPNNIGIYSASTILKIDPSLENILLKGIGSVYERADDNSDWYKVTDFDLEDDFMITNRLTKEWSIEINNLFERSIEEDGTLYYTTGNKSIRLSIWNSNLNREALFEEYKKDVENRDQTKSKTLQQFDFSDSEVFRIGYLIEETDKNKTYNLIIGFSIVDQKVIQTAFYFDEKSDLDWAISTWKNITFNS